MAAKLPTRHGPCNDSPYDCGTSRWLLIGARPSSSQAALLLSDSQESQAGASDEDAGEQDTLSLSQSVM
jgi:hypothetical protein